MNQGAYNIFVLDDDPMLCEGISEALDVFGRVSAFQKAEALFQALEKETPDVLFLDMNLGEKNITGLDVLRQYKKSPDSISTTMIMITGEDSLDLYREAHRSGIEHYLEKPIQPVRLQILLENIIFHKEQKVFRNPLTGMPGNPLIEAQVNERKGSYFSCAYIDLDYFKPFNDTKGVEAGDRAILLLGEIILDARNRRNRDSIFAGHLGGDDFFLVGEPGAVRSVARETMNDFETKMRRFFTEEENDRGYYSGISRENLPSRFPLLAMSISVLDIPARYNATFKQIGRSLSPIKKRAKAIKGFSLAEGVFPVARRAGKVSSEQLSLFRTGSAEPFMDGQGKSA